MKGRSRCWEKERIEEGFLGSKKVRRWNMLADHHWIVIDLYPALSPSLYRFHGLQVSPSPRFILYPSFPRKVLFRFLYWKEMKVVIIYCPSLISWAEAAGGATFPLGGRHPFPKTLFLACHVKNGSVFVIRKPRRVISYRPVIPHYPIPRVSLCNFLRFYPSHLPQRLDLTHKSVVVNISRFRSSEQFPSRIQSTYPIGLGVRLDLEQLKLVIPSS